MKRILLVEDDEGLGATLQERLSKEGYFVSWSKTIQTALIEMQNSFFHLALLDVGLPDGSGFDLAKQIGKKKSWPIVFMTAQSDAENRLHGYELGAEEFIPKPFHLKELLMRVRHVLEKHTPLETYSFEDLIINFTEGSVASSNQDKVMVPHNEMRLLQLLIERSPQIIPREDLVEEIWGLDKDPSPRTIDNMVARLRSHLGPKWSEILQSVRGQGYRWMNIKMKGNI